MKFDWKKLKRSALQSLGRLAVRMRAFQRRFRHAGGFPGLFRRTGQNLRRREPPVHAQRSCLLPSPSSALPLSASAPQPRAWRTGTQQS